MEELEELKQRIKSLSEVMPKQPNVFMPYYHWIKQKDPFYYKCVMDIIDELASITFIHGHSNELDKLKEDAYELIKL